MNLVRFQKPAYTFKVNNLLNDVMNDFAFATNNFNSKFAPSVNIREDNEEFKLDFRVPGYSKEDLKIVVSEGVLTVKAELEKIKEKTEYNFKEFQIDSFERSFKLPDNVDIENVNAKYMNGVLHVGIPKKEIVSEEKMVSIAIQ